MNKTQKSVSKRIRITRKGKVMRRKLGLDHFKTRKSSKANREKRRPLSLDSMDGKVFKKYLPQG